MKRNENNVISVSLVFETSPKYLKIHAVVDALGKPLSFHSFPSQACDLDGADQLLPNIIADTVLADKGYDADERVIERLIRHRVKPQSFPPSVTVITLVTTTGIYTKPVNASENFFCQT